MYSCLEVSVEAHVAHVALNRPQKHNAINFDMFREFGEVGGEIAANRAVRAVVVSGNGENFCAGIDTSIFGGEGVEMIANGLQPQPPSPANMFQLAGYVWREIPVPVICALKGVVFGGGMQIALGADIRYAAPDARLSIMEIKWGIIPDMAITTTARGIVPVDRLKELAFTGQVVSGEEALETGLVTGVHEDPLAHADETAAAIAGKSPDAIRAMKRMINTSLTLDEPESLALEARLQSRLLGEQNQLEAVQANMEKRAPEFKD